MEKSNPRKITPLVFSQPKKTLESSTAEKTIEIIDLDRKNEPDKLMVVGGSERSISVNIGPSAEEELKEIENEIEIENADEMDERSNAWLCCLSDKSQFNSKGSLGSTLKYLVHAHKAYKVLTIFITFAVIIDVIALELRYANDNKSNAENNVLKCLGSLATIISVFLLREYYRYMNLYNLSKTGYEIKKTNTFATPELRNWFIMETLFLFVHSIPFVDGGVNIQEHTTRIRYHFSFDELLGSFQIFRILVWLRGFHVWKGVATNMKNATFASMKKLEFNAWFTLRQQLYLKPLTTLLFILATGATLGGYVLMVCERPNSAEFAWFANSIWVVLVTMTTVGYGDLYPSSMLGRMIAIAACLLGNFLFGLLVTSQASLIELSHPEKQATESLELMGHTKADSEDAARVVVAALNYKYALKKFNLTKANEKIRNKHPKIREAHDLLIKFLKQRRLRGQKFKKNKRRDESSQILQTLKLQSHLVMDLNRNVRDLGLVVAKLKLQMDSMPKSGRSGSMDSGIMKFERKSESTDSGMLLEERIPTTPAGEVAEIFGFD